MTMSCDLFARTATASAQRISGANPPPGPNRRNVFEVIGRWLLSMASYFEVLKDRLRQFGLFLIELAKTGYGDGLRVRVIRRAAFLKRSVALFTFAPMLSRQRAAQAADGPSRPHFVLVFDTGTYPDEAQRFRFGSFQFRAGGVLRYKGFFYDPECCGRD